MNHVINRIRFNLFCGVILERLVNNFMDVANLNRLLMFQYHSLVMFGPFRDLLDLIIINCTILIPLF